MPIKLFEKVVHDYAAMGGGWNGRTDDYSLDWGRYHLAMMDCFAHYDAQNVLVRSSFTHGQLGWLRRDLEAASASRLRLVFAHYDYHRQLPLLFSDLRVDAFFYGHAKGLYPQELERYGVWNGHLADTQAYNLVHFSPDGIAAQVVSWEGLRSRGPAR